MSELHLTNLWSRIVKLYYDSLTSFLKANPYTGKERINNLYKISIVGAGYVGLCTAVCFANRGYKTTISDIREESVRLIQRGSSPFYEPHLNELLKKAIKSGNLRAILDREGAILDSEITFIAVGTPSTLDGSVDLHYVKNSAIETGEALRKKDGYHLVVVKSTVLPGTTEHVVESILEKKSGKKAGKDFGLCMNPEFLREGSAIQDTMKPDRVIVGEHDERSGETLEAFYNDFYNGRVPILRMNPTSAEMVKYASNAFLATKISFINSIANVCERTPNTDVTQVAKAVGMDHRISPHFLEAGAGFGGSCFPKDVKALIGFSKNLSYVPTLLESVLEVNEGQAERMVELARQALGRLNGKKVAVLGLAFKPDTDDVREAPSIRIISLLLRERASVCAYDPIATENAKAIFDGKIDFARSSIECLKNADCCMVATEWSEFKTLKPGAFLKHMKRPIIVDGRRIYNPSEFSRELKYIAIGLGQERYQEKSSHKGD